MAAAATVKIAAGAYRVGCHPQLDGCERDAMPQHVVNLQALAVDADEVRSDLYAACVAQGACTPAGRGPGCNAGAAGHDAQPINCVDARQAASYCSWRGGRLPTEAEWESAARGGEVRRYPWGGPFPDCSRTTIASILGPGCGRQATTAAGDPPADTTPSGVRGLGGNVAEWTASPYASYPDGAAFVSGDVVVRGGHFRDEAAQVPLTWQRRHLAPTTSSPTVGFRCFYDAGAPSLER